MKTSHVSNSYFYIEGGCISYREGPKPSSAVRFLKTLRNAILKKRLKKNDTNLRVDQIALKVLENYEEKLGLVGMFKDHLKQLVFSYTHRINMIGLCGQIQTLTSRQTIFAPLSDDVICDNIGPFLSLKDDIAIMQVNKHGQALANSLLLFKARRFGYRGDDVDEAKRHMIYLFEIIHPLYKKKVFREKCLSFTLQMKKELHE